MIIAIGLNILEIIKIRVTNLLPALSQWQLFLYIFNNIFITIIEQNNVSTVRININLIDINMWLISLPYHKRLIILYFEYQIVHMTI